jgi:hypothetical protein
MALVTTGMTEPLLHLAYPDRILLGEVAAAERAELSEPESYTVLVWITDSLRDGSLVELAASLLGRETPARLVLCQFLPQPKFRLEVASGLGAELNAITTAGDALRNLVRQTQSPDVNSTVVARFSANPLADVVALAETVGADMLVEGQSNEFQVPRIPASWLGPAKSVRTSQVWCSRVRSDGSSVDSARSTARRQRT